MKKENLAKIKHEDQGDFTYAAAAAKKDGKKKFTFQGKEYPVTIKTDDFAENVEEGIIKKTVGAVKAVKGALDKRKAKKEKIKSAKQRVMDAKDKIVDAKAGFKKAKISLQKVKSESSIQQDSTEKEKVEESELVISGIDARKKIFKEKLKKLGYNKESAKEKMIPEAEGNAPFKELESAWRRTNGDPAKEAKLIKKHELQRIFSANRPGDIKLGILNKLQGTKKLLTFAGIDDDDKLVFVSNNPVKIYYPKKGTHRPKGKGIKSIFESRLEKIVSIITEENDDVLLPNFIEACDITEEMKSSEIKAKYEKWLIS
jgi:hypothetical protein